LAGKKSLEAAKEAAISTNALLGEGTEYAKKYILYHENGHGLAHVLSGRGSQIASLNMRGNASAMAFVEIRPPAIGAKIIKEDCLEQSMGKLGAAIEEEVVYGKITRSALHDVERARDSIRSYLRGEKQLLLSEAEIEEITNITVAEYYMQLRRV